MYAQMIKSTGQGVKSLDEMDPQERAFQESRRRTKVIPHFFTEKACLKLVFSALWKTSQRWRKVTMTELEQQQLKLLRKELELSLVEGGRRVIALSNGAPTADDHHVGTVERRLCRVF